MELGTDYNLYISDNGPIVFSPSPFSLQVGLQLPDATMTLPFGMTRGEAIEFMRTFKASVSTIISHEFLPCCSTPLTDSHGFIIDDFGMYVYAYSFYSPSPSNLTDNRYESDLPSF